MSKSSGNTYKIYFILYLAVILELLLVIVERDDAEDDLKKQKSNIEQAVVTFLTQLAQPPEAYIRQEVIKIYADADEGSGIINKKTFSDTIFYITIRGVHDLETIKNVELNQAIVFPLSGKASREPKPDSIVKRELDLSKDSLNNNYVKIHFDRRFLELLGKDTVLRVPVTINFDRTGFYKFKFDYYFDKLTFVPNAKNPDSIKLGNITAAFHIVYNMEMYTKLGPKVLEGEKNYQPDKLDAIIKELNNQWNRAENILIIQVIDSSIPEPERPPKVKIITQ